MEENYSALRPAYIRDKVPFMVVKSRVPSYNQQGNPFYFGQPKPENRPEAISRMQEYILIGPEVVDADDGIYTWIIKAFADGRQMIVAASPLCNQEIGTLHANLDQLTTDGVVVIAGEMEKKAGAVIFNFLSGTYSAKKPVAEYPGYIALFKRYFPDAVYNPVDILARAPLQTCLYAAPNLRFFNRRGGSRRKRRVTKRRRHH